MRVLVTGAAGFIGSHLAERLLADGLEVGGFDNFHPFYDPAIKRRNIEEVFTSSRAAGRGRFTLLEGDLRDEARVTEAFTTFKPDVLIHLAAMAGVRPSIQDPGLYMDVNVRGTQILLEQCRRQGVRHVLFASSSSVYGANEKVPFAEGDPVDHPISPYAATKKAGELIAYTYHHLYGLSIACLRFFTVYGPRQRPDLAIHKFARLIDAGRPLPFFGDGSSRRDYTYIDDTLGGILGALRWVTVPGAPRYDLFNLGESRTVTLSRLVEVLEEALGKRAILDRQPDQPGDVPITYADIRKAREMLGYDPRVQLEEGIPRFVEWFRSLAR